VFLIRLLDQFKQTNGSGNGSEENSTPKTTTIESTIALPVPKQSMIALQTSKQSTPSSQGESTGIKPLAKALYDFAMNPMDDEGCLKFTKGMLIEVTRRVDQNWAEGKLGDVVGIFPLSFVNMNPVATALMQSYATKWRLPGVAEQNSQTPSTSTSPQRQVPAVLQPSPITAPLSPDKTGIYIALHSYTPQKPDELELKKGSQYFVKEVCKDGWLKGASADNLFSRGVFPGNYVMPLIYHQKMVAMQQRNQTNLNTQSMRNANGAYTNLGLGLSSVPPELPTRNQTTVVTMRKSTEAQAQQKTESDKQKRESVTEMLMKKLGYSRKSSDSSAYSCDNPVFEDAQATAASAKLAKSQQQLQFNHNRSGSCPTELGININFENLQIGSQSTRVKTRERVGLQM
jgi:hypothetical protein